MRTGTILPTAQSLAADNRWHAEQCKQARATAETMQRDGMTIDPDRRGLLPDEVRLIHRATGKRAEISPASGRVSWFEFRADGELWPCKPPIK